MPTFEAHLPAVQGSQLPADDGELQLAESPDTRARLREALRAAFTGYEANDRSKLMALLAPDFRFEMSDSLPYGGTYVGPAEFAAFWREVGKEWQYFRYEAHDIIESGDTWVVPVVTDALSVRNIRLRNEHLFLFTAHDGLFTFARVYADTARGRDVMEGREIRRFPRAVVGPS